MTTITNNKLTGLGENHPANGPLTTERLTHVRDVLQRNLQYSNGGSMDYIIADAVKAIDELLAGRKAEPDYIRYDCGCCGWEAIEDWRDNDVCPKCNHKPMGKTELFIAPPAPVVPATLPCSVELKPGLIIGKGCKTETLLTALQRRADYYAEIDAMTPEERAEHDANIEAFKAMLPQPVPDERKAFEAFMDNRFGDTIDQSRAKNGDHGYMAWDMVVAWIVWQGRAAMLNGGK